MPEEEPPRSGSLLPTIVFALLVAALVAGVWVFPRVYAYMTEQDCIASGRTNCVRFAPPADAQSK
jgi:hypothetical protein